MQGHEVHSLQIVALAQRLLTDIRQRGLAVGDRYLTTEELSRMLGVRRAMAGQAVRHLAEREILIPRQRSGTFIGPGLGKQKRSNVQTVFVLLPAGDPAGSLWAYQPFVAGIRSAIAEVNVQFTFVPENEPVAYVGELLDSAQSSGQFAGVVAVSCPPEVYGYLAEQRVSAVVYGSLYSSEFSLASVDVDNSESGRLLTRYLVDCGHRRMALLTTGAGRPGNDLFLDGINDVLSAAALSPKALVQRSVRNDVSALQAIAKDLLERSDRPTAVITRGATQASAIASVAAAAGLAVPGDVDVVFDHERQSTANVDVTLYPRVEPKMTFPGIAAVIGNVLKEMSEKVPLRPQRVLVPVEFHKSGRKS